MSYKVEKPGVVTAVQVIMWIQVAVSVLAGCVIGTMRDSLPLELQKAAALAMFIYIGMGLLSAAVVVGIANRRRWARIGGIVLSFLGLLGVFVNAEVQQPFATVLGLGVSVTLLICLFNIRTVEWCSE